MKHALVHYFEYVTGLVIGDTANRGAAFGLPNGGLLLAQLALPQLSIHSHFRLAELWKTYQILNTRVH